MTRSYEKGELTVAILGHLYRNPAASVRGVAAALDVKDRQTVRIILGRMQERGLVRLIGDSGYLLTEGGLARVAHFQALVSS